MPFFNETIIDIKTIMINVCKLANIGNPFAAFIKPSFRWTIFCESFYNKLLHRSSENAFAEWKSL